MTRTVAMTLTLLLATSLGGCGKVGQLERPGPMFGRTGPTDADAALGKPQDPSRPMETVDPRDRSTEPSPARTVPIPGTSPGATGVAPQSALPDPYANPRR